MSYIEAKIILRNNFRMEWQQRLAIGTEEDSIHQLDRAAQVAIFRMRTGHCQLLSHLHRQKISHSDECPCGPTNYILQSCPTFDADKAQSSGCPKEALGTGWDTEVDCGLRLNHRTEDLAWPGTQKKKKKTKKTKKNWELSEITSTDVCAFSRPCNIKSKSRTIMKM